MKAIAVLLAAVGTVGCASNSGQTEVRGNDPRLSAMQAGQEDGKLAEFKEANFGVHFSYGPDLSVQYNPHGGANRVVLAYRSKPVGGLLICSRPPPGQTREFIAAGIEYMEEKFGASRVSYRQLRGSSGYRWHCLSARTSIEGGNYIVERYVYVSEPGAPCPGPAQLADLFGAYSFEFLYGQEEAASIKPQLMIVINSFRIEDNP